MKTLLVLALTMAGCGDNAPLTVTHCAGESDIVCGALGRMLEPDRCARLERDHCEALELQACQELCGSDATVNNLTCECL